MMTEIKTTKEYNMKLVNLTPHTLNIHSNGQVLEVAPSGIVARVKVDRVKLKNIIVGDFTIAVNSTKYGDVIDLPDPVKGTIYVVSALVLQRANERVTDWNEREDLFSPGELARNAEGVVVGCHGLSR